MILVADSGSTKADWRFSNNNGEHLSFSTKGMNPFFHDKKFIVDELQKNEVAVSIKEQVRELYFFGAGCSSVERNSLIRNGLNEFFVNSTVVVEHDMLACALSVCNGNPGLACILGTGSNISYFDGSTLSENRHGLGYVLGDEGSGSYFGKKLLRYYVYKLLPSTLESAFHKKYNLTKESIINSVYNEPNPNVYLASFAPFLSDHISDSFIRKLIQEGIEEFFDTNILSYSESKQVPVHFVGSIAWSFRDFIKGTAASRNIKLGTIIQKPINGLADYFFKGGKMPAGIKG